MEIKKIQLITAASAVGYGANDGSYPPIGLLTIASAIINKFSNIKIIIDDQHHQYIIIDPNADIVGIQVASTLCYKNALEIARQAKSIGKIVVLGGHHVSALHQQIMKNRSNLIDFAIRGKGEKSFVDLITALERGETYSQPENCPSIWNYDAYLPLPFNLLSSGIKKYWDNFKKNINPDIDASFVIFTHFGCQYRQRQTEQGKPFCLFCSLDDIPLVRKPENILQEIKDNITNCQIEKGARIHLKCYGDNIGPNKELIKKLSQAIEECPWWQNYQFSWTFYCQSSFLSDELAKYLKRIGTASVFIGFDGVDDYIQRINGLGTSKRTHQKAIKACQKYGIKIQAASVVGLKEETPETLEELYQFFKEMGQTPDLLERVNSAVLFIIPGTAAYQMLTEKELKIKEWDLLPTSEIRDLWIKHFCPKITRQLLEKYASKISQLSPGPKASMGYEK